MTSAMATGVGMDAGNKSMRAGGRTAWNEDDVAAASGGLSQARGLISNGAAAAALHSGTSKSAPVPVHDAMSNIYGSGGTPRPARYGGGGGTQAWNGFGR